MPTPGLSKHAHTWIHKHAHKHPHTHTRTEGKHIWSQYIKSQSQSGPGHQVLLASLTSYPLQWGIRGKAHPYPKRLQPVGCSFILNPDISVTWCFSHPLFTALALVWLTSLSSTPSPHTAQGPVHSELLSPSCPQLWLCSYLYITNLLCQEQSWPSLFISFFNHSTRMILVWGVVGDDLFVYMFVCFSRWDFSI